MRDEAESTLTMPIIKIEIATASSISVKPARALRAARLCAKRSTLPLAPFLETVARVGSRASAAGVEALDSWLPGAQLTWGGQRIRRPPARMLADSGGDPRTRDTRARGRAVPMRACHTPADAMRICQVVHGFPPVERTGVENYTLALCRALARAGHRVEVFVPRRAPELADLALRREERDGFAINWLTHNHAPASAREALLVPDLEGAFAAFLERERPEVVHFQHLIKLGIGLVSVARARGLPTIYTAHDYYPICHRYTLLRPDLSRCDARGDAAACGRCDLAAAHVNAQPGIGDYHAGVFESQLAPAAWAKLQDVLAGRPVAEEPTAEAYRAATEQREELEHLRAEAYRAFDLVLAPSRHLIGELERGGFERARVQHAPLGFDNQDLAHIPRVRAEPGRAPRFAFVGGLAKHKGVHVLLDAFALIKGGAELSVWGGSSDRAYVELVRRRCGEVGAQWRGPFERADLPAILAEVDALVVPSIWLENYPLVIHEAFSAGRPVLASRLGAIPESVLDGVNGLLFAPGDAEDLARVLARCAEEPGLLARLARGIGPVKSMEQEARELAGRYEGLCAEQRAARAAGEMPRSLIGVLGEFEGLAALSSRELFTRTLSGLDRLRKAWARDLGPVEAVELLALGLGAGSEAQDRLREARNEIAWLRTKKEEVDDGREELIKVFEDLERLLNETQSGNRRQAEHLESAGVYVRRKEQEVSAAHARMHELETVIADKNRYIGEVEGHLHEAARYIRHKDQEYLELERALAEAGTVARGKEDELRQATAVLQEAQDTLQKSEEERLGLDQGARSAAQVGVLALQAQERLLGRALRPMLVRLHELVDPGGTLNLPAEGASFVELLENVAQARAGLEAAARELEWLRPQREELQWCRERMTRLVQLYRSSSVVRLVLRPSALGRKLERWSAQASEEARA
jgi:glycosyltransferase involved in cell wall biosynthesis